METKSSERVNYFVRILIIIFCSGLATMIAYSFFFVQPIGVIKSGLFTLLGMLLILVLAESFDSFSLGKLISIKRKYKLKKEENIVLERRNAELINQIISVSNNLNQKQESTTVFGTLYQTSRKNVQVGKSENSNVQELLDQIGSSVVITEMERRITTDLDNKDLPIDSETARVLLRHLAGSQLLLQFENIHSLIFGSQIYLLKELNPNNSMGMKEEDVVIHFEKVKQTYPDSFLNWDCEQYLSFLYARVLIVKSEEDKLIHLTNFGGEYLVWIARNGRTETKPL